MRKNGSDTALTVEMANDGASASADVAAVTFADTDILEMVCTTAGSPSNSPSAVIVVIG